MTVQGLFLCEKSLGKMPKIILWPLRATATPPSFDDGLFYRCLLLYWEVFLLVPVLHTLSHTYSISRFYYDSVHSRYYLTSLQQQHAVERVRAKARYMHYQNATIIAQVWSRRQFQMRYRRMLS